MHLPIPESFLIARSRHLYQRKALRTAPAEALIALNQGWNKRQFQTSVRLFFDLHPECERKLCNHINLRVSRIALCCLQIAVVEL